MPSLYRTHLTTAPRAAAVADAAERAADLVAPVHRASTIGQQRDFLAQAAHGSRRARLGTLEPAEAGVGESEVTHAWYMWQGSSAHFAAHDGRR